MNYQQFANCYGEELQVRLYSNTADTKSGLIELNSTKLGKTQITYAPSKLKVFATLYPMWTAIV